MPDARTCPRCGTTIPADAPESLCPRCLLEGLPEGSTFSRTADSLESSGLRAGQDLGRYRLVRRLGRGGFGEVWEAQSHETGRHTALKLLPEARHASAEALERFAREGRLAASLSHPRCVFVFGADTVDGYPAIDMELMDGGTLQDMLGREGAMPYPRAVDAVLDVIDGLEAAHAAGILHRDVKPSNAFVDAEGRVKIGDFGLSKSLEDQELLSSAGGFIGTPSYASPEQVRGAELDVRSDIYSVGATLYALLAGHAPFRGRRATEVLAKILADEPPPLPAAVPRSLARVVRRTLAKSPEARFPTHAALRSALLPFSSRGLRTADLARRVAARVVDCVLLLVPALLVYGLDGTDRYVAFHTAVTLAYYSITEGIWGASFGKRLLGLRVVGRDDRPIGVGRACLRAAVYLAFIHVAWVPTYVWGPAIGEHGTRWLVAQLFLLASWLVFVTMRRRNGYSGVHELASGTWVRAVTSGREPATAPVAQPAAEALPGLERRFGPYIEGHPIHETAAEGVLLAWDPVLRRNVWIHHFDPSLPIPPPSQLALTTRHRLRWLQGTRQGDRHWDAYEAPQGTTLAAWIDARGALGWGDLRGVLRESAVEIARTLAQRDARSVVSASRVWVDKSGSVRLLDFALGPEDGGAFPPSQWRAFLHQLVHFALNGRLEAMPLDRVPMVPLPEPVRPLLESLCNVGPPFDSPSEVAARLDELAVHPAAVTRRRRLAAMMPSAVPAAAMLVMLGIALTFYAGSADVRIAVEAESHAKLMVHETTAERREARRVLMGAAWAKLDSSFARLAVPREAPERAALDEARREYGAASETQLREARRLVGAPYRIHSWPLRGVLSALIGPAAILLIFGAVLAAILAVVFPGGLSFLVFGIAVQDMYGDPAGPVRSLVRAVCAWSPMWLLFAYWKSDLYWSLSATLPTLSVVAMAVGAAYAAWRPERGLQDLLAGTRLVPR